MNKKGFTLIELIAVITLFSIISLLVFGALTGSIRSASVKEMEVYRDNVSRAAQVYVETNLENYTLNNPGEYLVLKGAKVIEAGYLDKSIKNPSSCPIEEVNIRIYMESDYTLSYAVYCDGEEPTLPDDSDPVEPEIPVEPDTPEAPSQTVYVFEYTGAVQEMTLPAGKWKLEVWGAQGGSYNSTYQGGKGGYSVGDITLDQQTTLYVYVGGQGGNGDGTDEGLAGGFNGGGIGTPDSGFNGNSGGGGGTDIRIANDNLYARVIVAGGGGGSAYYEGSGYEGGYAGGEQAGNGYRYGYTSNTSYISYGASMIGPGEGRFSFTTAGNGTRTGAFGIGASSTSSNGTASGGGGGWYGGASGYNCGTSGGGGSGWVYTSSNFSTWQTGNPTDAANWLLNSSYYLTNSENLDGATSFSDPDGTTVTGHSGNGYARITWISN